MNYEVQLSDRAQLDIDEVTAWFVSQHASDASDRWLSAFFQTLSQLSFDPSRHQIADEFLESGREIRELHHGKRPNVHRVFFEIHGGTVSVLRIWHSARASLGADEL